MLEAPLQTFFSLFKKKSKKFINIEAPLQTFFFLYLKKIKKMYIDKINERPKDLYQSFVLLFILLPYLESNT